MEKTEPGASLGTEFQPGPCTGGSWGVLSSPVGRVPSYHCLERPGGGRGPPGGGLHPSPGGDRVRASQRAGRGVTASLQPRPRPAPPAWRNPGGGGGGGPPGPGRQGRGEGGGSRHGAARGGGRETAGGPHRAPGRNLPPPPPPQGLPAGPAPPAPHQARTRHNGEARGGLRSRGESG